jgi:hypothetical protein
MNELLRETLTERADGVEPPPLDLDGIVTAGNHRITRRRAVTVLGGAALTLAAVAGGVTIARSIDHRPAPAKLPAFTERRPTYALGGEIHYGSDVISVAPHRVSAFVQTDTGFVFLDETNDIYVADRAGVQSVGRSTWRLAAGHNGSLVGWIEGYNDHSESVVYDVAAGRELVRTAVGNQYGSGSIAISPRIVAIDGDHAYFGTLHGLYRWDVRADKGELIAEVPPNAVRTVVSGQLVYQRPLVQPTTGLGLAIGTTLTNAGGVKFNGQQAFLSPGAKHLVTQPDDVRMGIEPSWAGLQLFEVATGRQSGLPYAYSTMVFGQWIDDDAFIAAGERRSAPSAEADLLSCSASGTCRVVAAAFSTFTFSKTPPRTTPFALPTGSAIYDLYS